MPRIFSDSSKYDIKNLSTTKNRCAFEFIQQSAKSVNISPQFDVFVTKLARRIKVDGLKKSCFSLQCKINKNRSQVKSVKENPTYLAKDS